MTHENMELILEKKSFIQRLKLSKNMQPGAVSNIYMAKNVQNSDS